MVTNEMIDLSSQQRWETSMERPRETNDALAQGRNPYKRREDGDASSATHDFWRKYGTPETKFNGTPAEPVMSAQPADG